MDDNKLATPSTPPSMPDQSSPTFETSPSKSVVPSPGKRSNKLLMLFAVMLVGVAVLAGVIAVVTQKKTTTTKQSTSIPSPAAVFINSSDFVPTNITIKVGTTITWTNNDTKPHRVASDPYPTNNGLPGFDSKQALQPKDTYSFTFEKAGTFPYHDDLHPYDIKGTIVVTPTQN